MENRPDPGEIAQSPPKLKFDRGGLRMPMAWKTGDRVRLLRTDIRGTVAEQPPDDGELPTFIWITWDDGMESWVDPDTLERP